ncbi:MAG: ABC transporter ATP-binding protein [Saprospiraceae bacterium]|nr:ABC transporter ATP-binding protein [Saprospiraceae bacterium]
MISLQNVEKVYQTTSIETVALDGINLEVQQGEFLSIMGPSGCGKSTLLNIMGLLDEPSAGDVILNGSKITGYSNKQLARFRNQNIGFIFQSYHLINDLKVIDNVELPLLYRNMSRKERYDLSVEALTKVGLKNRIDHFPNQLSGGQRQRVAIARAIVGKPTIILADEPTGNLDSRMGNEIMDILLKLNEEEGTTIVMVTHDESMALKTHRLARLFDGTWVEEKAFQH